MFVVFFVLQDVEKLEDILNAWEKAGAGGVTIIPSIGLARLKEKSALREDFPIIPTLEDLIETPQENNRTLFTVVTSTEVKDEIISSTLRITGDLNLPNSGLLFTVPVDQAFGLNRTVLEKS